MDDERVWSFEKSLWTGDVKHCRQLIDEECVMIVPTPPFVRQGDAAIDAVVRTSRWEEVENPDGRIVRPQEGLIVLAYKANAHKGGFGAPHLDLSEARPRQIARRPASADPAPDAQSSGGVVTEKKGHGSATAQTANAKAAKEGKKNPRASSAAQSELGKKGGKKT